jgi:hypothetical protein
MISAAQSGPMFADGATADCVSLNEAALECVVLGNAVAVDIGEQAQRQSIGDWLAQFVIIPVLRAHQNQRALDLQ